MCNCCLICITERESERDPRLDGAAPAAAAVVLAPTIVVIVANTIVVVSTIVVTATIVVTTEVAVVVAAAHLRYRLSFLPQFFPV